MIVAVIVVGAVALMLAVALVFVGVGSGRAHREATEAAEEASSAREAASAATTAASESAAAASSATAAADAALARARDAEAKAADAEQRARASEARADAASAAAAASAADPAAPGSPVIDAVWALQRLQVTLARRDLARISTAAAEPAAPAGLADALAEEVARIREEIGTPGELQSGLGEEPPPAVALLALRATETLLPILTRRSDAYDLQLSGAGRQVEVAVACEGAEPDAFPDADTDAVAAAIVGAGGTLSFDRTDDGRVRARLRCGIV